MDDAPALYSLPKSTNCIHQVRKNLGLSFLEYAFADGINTLSNNPEHEWCTIHRDDLAEFYDISTRSIQRIINKLEESGFILRSEEGYLKTTFKWIQETQLDRVTNCHTQNYDGDNLSPQKSIDAPTEEVMGDNLAPSIENTQEKKVTKEKNNNNISNNNNINLVTNSYLDTNVTIPVTEVVNPRLHSDEELEKIAKDILKHYNLEFKQSLRSVRGWIDNLDYWLQDYSPEDIKKAITNAKNDSYWSKIITPELLMRKQKATNGFGERQRVDRIGNLIAREPDMVDPNLAECTELAVWKVAKEFNVPLEHVKRRFLRIVALIKSGEFAQRNKKMTALEALKFWINNDLAYNNVGHCDEVEAINLEYSHPDKLKQERILNLAAIMQMKANGDL